jgi:hypothetical protein
MRTWIAFVFRDAVNPSLDAVGKTPVFHTPENKHRSTLDARDDLQSSPLRFSRLEQQAIRLGTRDTAAGGFRSITKFE